MYSGHEQVRALKTDQ